MANEIQELLNEIRDQRLKQRLSTAVGELRKAKKFGLVFEEHLPELLPIYSAKIRSRARVARRDGRLTDTFIVERVAKGVATVKPEQGEGEPQSIPVEDLVVVKRFGEAIFPALRHVESVVRGGDAPHHTLIEADNYHALQLLEWLYAGQVDCIYIDPPYNTGGRDWKFLSVLVDCALIGYASASVMLSTIPQTIHGLIARSHMMGPPLPGQSGRLVCPVAIRDPIFVGVKNSRFPSSISPTVNSWIRG